MGRIVQTEGVVGGEPRLEGRRISVLQVADMVIEGGYEPAYVADQLELSLAEVHSAMAYYYDHPEEMDELREHHAELESELQTESSAPESVEQSD